jgi:outer membrane protein OmpA-like peptidoglycan-associated protein
MQDKGAIDMDLVVVPLITILGYLVFQDPPQDHVTLLPDSNGKVGAVIIKTAKGEQLLQTAYASAEISNRGHISIKQVEAGDVHERYKLTLAALPAKPASFTVYFVSGSDKELTPESVPVLEQLKAALASRPAPEIMVIGHTDRVGKLEDNDALSVRRASNVRDILVGVGVQGTTIDIAGRGERETLVPTADEIAEEKNRRVEISVR